MILVTTSDFFTKLTAGSYLLAQAIKSDDTLQSYINNNEASTIRQLLGINLGNIVINSFSTLYNTSARGNYDAIGNVLPSTGGSGSGGAIVAGDTWIITVAGLMPVTGSNPAVSSPLAVGDKVFALVSDPGQTSQNWGYKQARIDAIVNPFSLQISNGLTFVPAYYSWWGWEWWDWSNCLWTQIYESKGLKWLCMGSIFYQYVKDQSTIYSQSGVITANAETANVKNMENGFRFAETRWNGILDTAASIQYQCFVNNPDLYPEYEGLQFEAYYSALL